MEPTDYGHTETSLTPDYGPPPDWRSWPDYRPPPTKRSRLKMAVGGAFLAGLLVVGGAATVFAADPTPSPSTSPSVTTPGTTHTPGNCPHMQNGSTNTSTNTSTSTGSSG